MNIEKIRSEAPEGATHYNQNGNYFCVMHFTFYMWNPYDQVWFATQLDKNDNLKPLF